MKKIFITGGAGFIGSHMAQKFLELGHEVSILDDLSTGSINNIEHLKGNKSFSYRIDTIFNEPLLREMIDASDVIFHMAASVGVRLIITDPVNTMANNIHGTEIVLKYAALKGKRTFIASSSEVYGKGSRIPFSEEDDIILGPTSKGRWSYACSKAIDEFMGLAYFKEYKLPATSFRLFNTVGPRQTGRYGMVIPRFVSAALKNEPVTVYGDGTQSRCFINVADVVDACVKLIDADKSIGTVVNIGSSEEISILDLGRKVIEMTGSKSQIQFIPYDQAMEAGFEDMQRRVPDTTRLRGIIDFEPRYTLKDTLSQVIDSIRPTL
ncbi:NAD(P)-dependent oxidoreductase [Oscillibacter sp.]|uniref:NAD-dependent epimerase/dehydratase family protein n=1 Tax=Oscillibacter sp. TaxID=1945593 RepID=UPI00262963CE|nr:GDP-mannose 4,6-dehydratase [Oscillibacter sp.]MDD3347628.1 GDP-mannose 4,6-dehydratase [Oscillibacter sp.]